MYLRLPSFIGIVNARSRVRKGNFTSSNRSIIGKLRGEAREESNKIKREERIATQTLTEEGRSEMRNVHKSGVENIAVVSVLRLADRLGLSAREVVHNFVELSPEWFDGGAHVAMEGGRSFISEAWATSIELACRLGAARTTAQIFGAEQAPPRGTLRVIARGERMIAVVGITASGGHIDTSYTI